MMNMRALFSLATVPLVFCACKPTTAPTTATVRVVPPITEAGPVATVPVREVIHLSDPDGDFAAAWARNDRHFVGIMGYALFLPGVPGEQQAYLRGNFGVKIVDGLTDVEDDRSAGLRQPANDYAVKYNTELLKKLGPP